MASTCPRTWVVACVAARAVACIVFFISASESRAEISQEEILRRLERLERAQQENLEKLRERDQRIEQLEQQLRQYRRDGLSEQVVRPGTAPAAPTAPAQTAAARKPERFGRITPGRGALLANTDLGSVSFSPYTYIRYLNQHGLDDHYTDAFGRTKNVNIREDLQLQKVMLRFMGWVFDPKLTYYLYAWTSNTSMGDGAQVVVAGNLTYKFSDAFSVAGGVSALPSTRSLENQWPNFLKVDNRTIADEYFRGSYTTGLTVFGTLAEGLQYRAMLGNNLSQLGVSASQLDDRFDTFAGAIWWMPSTGEYGPNQGFGDFEHHDRLATRVGIHYSNSTEDEQSRPDAEDPENTQLKLSDGTSLFDIDAFGPGIWVQEARYQMAAVDAGFKYRGFALEGEYYWRWIDQFRAIGEPPVSDLFDHGFQLQASMMVLPKRWQLYLSGSKIFGEYGDPYDVALGTNWFPKRGVRQIRLNAELLYLYRSPVGYTAVPFAVGGKGTVFNTNLEFTF